MFEVLTYILNFTLFCFKIFLHETLDVPILIFGSVVIPVFGKWAWVFKILELNSLGAYAVEFCIFNQRF